MYQSINFSQFCDSFHGTSHEHNFSYEGKRALFDYLEQLEDDTETKIELDTVALCCDYTEFDSLEDIQAEYPQITSLETLQDATTTIECSNGHIIILAF